MTFHKLSFVLPGLAGALLCYGFFFQSADQLFQTAVYQEEVEGNLKGAIETYQTILKRFPADRPMGAKAQLRIGLCHLKLGNKEAQSAFQKVINDYADQADAVKQAREQLSTLLRAQLQPAKGSGEYKITKIHTDTRPGYPSPDGTRLALIDDNLYIRNIESGKEVHLLPTRENLYDVFWSPDSKLIAYPTGTDCIRIISADGGQPRTIIEPDAEMNRAGRFAWPTGWTSDSKKLLFQVSTRQAYEGLYAIPVTGGKWEEIYRFPDPQKAKERNEWMTLSPDGKHIAYGSKQDGKSDIYVMPAQGGAPVRITDDSASNGGPRWSYDSQWLAFSSRKAGDSETWVIRITPDGKPGSRPVLAARGAGNAVWTQDGKIVYSTGTDSSHVFVTNTDGTREVRLTRVNNYNFAPRWSPDGKNIAFLANYGVSPNRFVVWTAPANGGDEKLLAFGGQAAWSPDGKRIAFCNEISRVGWVVVKGTISIVSADGGEAKEVINYGGNVDFLDWSPDGRNIVFAYRRVKDGKNPIPDSRESGEDIYLVPVTGGQPKRLTRFDKEDLWSGSPRWSPDGKKIAFLWMNRAGVAETGALSEPASIYTMDADGGQLKLVTNEDPDWRFCWSRDGKNIIFKKSGGGLHKVPAEGGKAEPMNIRGSGPDLSPDGKKIVFSRGENRIDFWLAENFLPVDKKEK